MYILTGDTSKDMEEIENGVKKSKECIMLVQSSISEGWEAPDVPCMIFASESYAHVDRTQAEGRILRANNLKKNLYVTLICGAADQRVHTTVIQKEDFHKHTHALNLSLKKKL